MIWVLLVLHFDNHGGFIDSTQIGSTTSQQVCEAWVKQYEQSHSETGPWRAVCVPMPESRGDKE